MKRLVFLLGVLLVLFAPLAAFSQVAQPLYPAAPPPGSMPPQAFGAPGMNFSPFRASPYMAGRELLPDERWVVAPYVRAGYQWMEFHANFPGPGVTVVQSSRIFDSMDLNLVDNNFWIGFVGLELQPVQDLVLYGELGANIATNVRMDMYANGRGTAAAFPPFVDIFGGVWPGENLDANLIPPWQWTGKDFQWWMAEAGGAWWVTPVIALDFGFRTEHVDFKLTNPRNNARRIDIEGNDPFPPYPGREIICTRI